MVTGNKKIIRVKTTIDEEGMPTGVVSTTPENDFVRKEVEVFPTKAIPIIFIPDVMGSPLRATGNHAKLISAKNKWAWFPDYPLDWGLGLKEKIFNEVREPTKALLDVVKTFAKTKLDEEIESLNKEINKGVEQLITKVTGKEFPKEDETTETAATEETEEKSLPKTLLGQLIAELKTEADSQWEKYKQKQEDRKFKNKFEKAMKKVGTDVTDALAKVVIPLDPDKIVNLIFPKSKGFTDLTPTERQQLLDPAETAALTAYDTDIEKRIISRIKRHLGKKDAAYDDQQLFGVQEALRRGWATVCWNSYGDFLINLENSLRHLTYSGGTVFQDGINETSLKNMPVFNDVFKLIDDKFPNAKGAILPGYIPAVAKTEQPQDADATEVTDVEAKQEEKASSDVDGAQTIEAADETAGDDEAADPEKDAATPKESTDKVDQADSANEEAYSKELVNHVDRAIEYHFPVFAVGYNWLGSNRQAAIDIYARLCEIQKYVEAKRRPKTPSDNASDKDADAAKTENTQDSSAESTDAKTEASSSAADAADTTDKTNTATTTQEAAATPAASEKSSASAKSGSSASVNKDIPKRDEYGLNLECCGFIIVTHSMGGLVGRTLLKNLDSFNQQKAEQIQAQLDAVDKEIKGLQPGQEGKKPATAEGTQSTETSGTPGGKGGGQDATQPSTAQTTPAGKETTQPAAGTPAGTAATQTKQETPQAQTEAQKRKAAVEKEQAEEKAEEERKKKLAAAEKKKEELNKKSEVAKKPVVAHGVIHGMHAFNGMAAIYRRMQVGWEVEGKGKGWFKRARSAVTSYAMGFDSKFVTPVFAQSPGLLEHVPSHLYKKDSKTGWLHFQVKKDEKAFLSLPVSDPYEDIYKQTRWYGLANPVRLSTDKTKRKEQWTKYLALMEKVGDFHKYELDGYVHPKTFAFYAQNETTPAFGELIWKVAQTAKGGKGAAEKSKEETAATESDFEFKYKLPLDTEGSKPGPSGSASSTPAAGAAAGADAKSAQAVESRALSEGVKKELDSITGQDLAKEIFSENLMINEHDNLIQEYLYGEDSLPIFKEFKEKGSLEQLGKDGAFPVEPIFGKDGPIGALLKNIPYFGANQAADTSLSYLPSSSVWLKNQVNNARFTAKISKADSKGDGVVPYFSAYPTQEVKQGHTEGQMVPYRFAVDENEKRKELLDHHQAFDDARAVKVTLYSILGVAGCEATAKTIENQGKKPESEEAQKES